MKENDNGRFQEKNIKFTSTILTHYPNQQLIFQNKMLLWIQTACMKIGPLGYFLFTSNLRQALTFENSTSGTPYTVPSAMRPITPNKADSTPGKGKILSWGKHFSFVREFFTPTVGNTARSFEKVSHDHESITQSKSRD